MRGRWYTPCARLACIDLGTLNGGKQCIDDRLTNGRTSYRAVLYVDEPGLAEASALRSVYDRRDENH